MKLQSEHHPARAGERGSAVVVVLILLIGVLAFVAANTSTLHSLKQELQLLEQRQLIKYGESGLTNQVMAPPAR